MKTVTDKAIALLLAVCMVLCLLPATAFAAEDTKPEVEVGTVSVKAGSTVSVPVSIKNNPGVAGVELVIDYDEDLLELNAITVKSGDLLSSGFAVPNVDARKMIWANTTEMTGDGTLFWLEFTALGKVDGESVISLQKPSDSSSALKNSEGAIADGGILLRDGLVEVEGYHPVVSVGDVSLSHRGTVSVPVTIADNPGIAGAELEIVYNEDVLELTGISVGNGALLSGGFFTPNVADRKMVWANATEVTDDGTLFWLEFTTTSDEDVIVMEGDYEVSVEPSSTSASAFKDFNGALDDDLFTFDAGTVTVKEAWEEADFQPEIAAASQPEDAEHPYMTTPGDLVVTVTVGLPGQNGLQYQWYRSEDNSNSTPEDDELLSGETENAYTPSAYADVGEYYYYCVVTNRVMGEDYIVTSRAVTVTCNAADIAGAAVSIAPLSSVYDGEEVTPEVAVFLRGYRLEEGVDYELSGDTSATDQNQYKIVVSGIGNYTGECTAVWYITQARFEGEVTYNLTVYNNGRSYELPEVELITVDGCTYQVIDYQVSPTGLDLITFDEDALTVTGNSEGLTGVNYIDARVVAPNHRDILVQFVIRVNNQRDASDSITLLPVDDSDMPVYDGEGHALSEFIDSALSDLGEIRYFLDGEEIDDPDEVFITEVGDHTVEVIYEDEVYFGSKSIVISVKPCPVDVSEWTWTYDSEEPFVYEEGHTYSVALSEENELSDVVSIKYSGKLSASDAGMYTASAKLTVVSENYVLVGADENGTVTLNWNILQAEVEIPKAAEGLVYSGEEQNGLPEADDTLYRITGNLATDAGTYTATLVLRDPDNYKWADEEFDGAVEWTIAKAEGLELVCEEPVGHRYSDTSEATVSAESLHDKAGDIVIVDVSIETVDGILGKAEVNEDGDLVCALRDGLSSDNAEEYDRIIITFSSQNYEESTYTLTVKVMGKDTVDDSIRFNGGSVTYNGAHQQPKSATLSGVKASGEAVWTYLFQRVDGDEIYDVEEMVNAGTYLVYAVYEDDDHYGVSEPVTFEIKPKSITVAGAVVGNSVYDGDTQLDPALVTEVTFKGVVSGDTVDYTVTGAAYNSADAGSKTVYLDIALTESGNYSFSGSYTTTYKKAKGVIEKKEVVVTVDPIEDQQYTGSKLTPALTVRSGEDILTAGTDYKATYSSNTSVGIAGVTLSFTSKNYLITLDPACEEITFRILPSDAEVTAVNDLTVTYTGNLPSADGIKGTAYFNGKKITGTWEWINPEEELGIDSGVYENVTVRFIPDNENLNVTPYEGTISVTVEPAVISITGAVVSDKEFDGTAELDPELVTQVLFGSVSLTKDVDYQVVSATYKDGKVAAGKALTIEVVLMDNPNFTFAKGAVEATYTRAKGNIIGRILDSVTVEGARDEMAYTGSAVTFDGLVVIGHKGDEQFVLELNKDYKIVYANNVDMGTGTATITVVGTNYSFAESTVLEFTIREPEEPDFHVEVNPVTGVYSGKALAASVLKGTVKLSGKTVKGKWSWAESADVEADLTFAHEERMVPAVFTISDSFAQFVEGGKLEVMVPVTVTPKVLTVSAATVVVEYGDPMDAAEIKVTLSGAIKGETVEYAAQVVGEFEDPNVGKSKTISVLVELSDPNYSFADGAMELVYAKGKGEVTRKTVEVFVEELPAVAYTGAAIVPELDVTFTADDVPVEVAYKLTCKNNKNAGTASVTMTCSDKNYIFETQQLTFVIEQARIEASDLVLEDVVATYSGKVPAATLIKTAVTDANGKALKGKWTWSVEPGSAAGEYEAEALFVLSDKNYTIDAVPVTVIIQQKEISVSAVKLLKSEYNDGDSTAQISSITFKGIVSKDVVDYTAEACYEDGEVGTRKAATVTVTLAEDGNYVFADGAYQAEYTKATGEIAKKKLTVTLSGVPESALYTGEAITFNELLTVYSEELGVLEEGVDYKVTYSSNVRVGTRAKVTITCINSNYTFTTVSQTFKIVKE